MEIRISEQFCILTPLSPKLGDYDTARLAEEIMKHPGFKIGLDLSYVNDCTVDFIDMIRSLKSIGLYNIPSDIFALLNIMDIDKTVGLYVSEADFKSEKHRLLNRKFSVI